ncbi:sulfatase family protein [Edaphobacter dinghuensis]|uniref:Sulfatase n=1 Tax=Edaphobacter dinghuensis TaxID=1560005 RepID=A0A917HCI4_9BACT|nr:sulfatase-like hydrolase/transferase [Edaphobacter dinghuensis]GGG74862.1 sulfatase [Edaphobacter dinghuensis]
MNILLIVCDALRGGLGKRAGGPDVCPTLDRMADCGASFNHAYCTIPLCVSSRISMLTGRWPDAHRVRMNLDARDAVFTQDIYQVAKARGYRTGLSGKNHTYLTASDTDFWREYGHEGAIGRRGSLEDQKFDRWIRTLDMGVAQKETPFPIESQISHRIVSDAIDFLKQEDGRPFFLQVSFPEPHGPSQLPKPYWNMFLPETMHQPNPGPEAAQRMGYRMQWLHRLEYDTAFYTDETWRRYISNYFGAIRMVDDQIARLFDFLRGNNLNKNTLIVFLADHGDYMMEYGLGRKGVGVYDALTHIPMIWAGPGVRQMSTPVFVSMADVMPTFCEAIGADIPTGVQGRSLWKLLRGQSVPAETFRSVYTSTGFGGLYYDAADNVPLSIAEDINDPNRWDTLNKVTQSGNQKMVGMGDWKLTLDMMGYGQLFHMTTDPHEQVNLLGNTRYAKVQRELMQELVRWMMRVEDTLTPDLQYPKHHTPRMTQTD